MNAKPYIGVTGIENPSQLERMLITYSQKRDTTHLLMIGGIVSYKTLIDIKDKHIVLMKNEIRNIFEELKNQPNEDVLFALHYFTKPLNEIRPELKEKARRVVKKTLYQQIGELFEDIYEDYEKTQPSFQIGVQINVSWPDPKDVNQIKTNYPRLKTILQVSDFSSVEEKIGEYNIDYALIDTSRGEGIDFDLNESIKVYKTINKINPVMIGFAGGFSPENVKERVCSIRKELNTRDFCIDAQGKLGDKVEKYLKEAIEAFQE